MKILNDMNDSYLQILNVGTQGKGNLSQSKFKWKMLSIYLMNTPIFYKLIKQRSTITGFHRRTKLMYCG